MPLRNSWEQLHDGDVALALSRQAMASLSALPVVDGLWEIHSASLVHLAMAPVVPVATRITALAVPRTTNTMLKLAAAFRFV